MDTLRAISIAESRPAEQYALRYSESAFRCLERQRAFLGDLTEDLLRRAGLAAGMTVLDIVAVSETPRCRQRGSSVRRVRCSEPTGLRMS